MRWACRFCPRCHRPQRHTWLGVQRTWLTPRSSLRWRRRSKCTKSRKSILAVFWVLSGHLESFWYIFAYLYTLDPLLFVPEWPFLQLPIQPWRGSDLRKRVILHTNWQGDENLSSLTYTTSTSLPWLLPPTAEFRRTGRVRAWAWAAAKCKRSKAADHS